MKAVILLGTLKAEGLSNTETLCEFLTGRMERAGITCDTVKLVDFRILPGTSSDMGPGDQWPEILGRVLRSDIVVIATPIWWSHHSSLIQRSIERLDELHDYVMKGKPSGLEGKVGGIVITGDSDGAQQVIGGLCNFFNGIGLLIPPYATLSVMTPAQAKGANTSRQELLRLYNADYASPADHMIEQLTTFARRGAGGVA